MEMCERRTAEAGDADPPMAAIVRTEGIDSGRPSVRYTDGRLTQAAGDDDRAASY
jgi:hypothetical protein